MRCCPGLLTLLLPFITWMNIPANADAQITDTALAPAIAPTGALRVALNLGNGVLVQQDRQSGELRGVTVELSRAIAAQLQLDLAFVTYGSANMAFADAANNVWDITFMGLEPERATQVSFTRPYVFIGGTYLVPTNASFRSVNDVDTQGVTIAAGSGSAYDLYLTRNITQAELVRSQTSALAIENFLAGNTTVVAGVRQTLIEAAQGRTDLRVLDDNFMRIEQAMAVPADRAPAVTAWLDSFIAEQIRTGFIRRALDTTGQAGVEVPQP